MLSCRVFNPHLFTFLKLIITSEKLSVRKREQTEVPNTLYRQYYVYFNSVFISIYIVLTGDDFISDKTDLDKELCWNSLQTTVCFTPA
jgi:hypothetical protein